MSFYRSNACMYTCVHIYTHTNYMYRYACTRIYASLLYTGAFFVKSICIISVAIHPLTGANKVKIKCMRLDFDEKRLKRNTSLACVAHIIFHIFVETPNSGGQVNDGTGLILLEEGFCFLPNSAVKSSKTFAYDYE